MMLYTVSLLWQLGSGVLGGSGPSGPFRYGVSRGGFSPLPQAPLRQHGIPAFRGLCGFSSYYRSGIVENRASRVIEDLLKGLASGRTFGLLQVSFGPP